MWLLPLFPPLARFAVHVFYHFRAQGAAVPAAGPVLLVANHPNALIDAAVVAAVAHRPVRFLAKAPLLSDGRIGWLVRGIGALPVYRPSDDPALVERNQEMFRAVNAELAAGAAVAIFPEGTTHLQPGMVPLKTGAARIALGTAREHAVAVPILPVGLTFRDRRFRSEALAVIGEPVEWADLAAAASDAPEAVRELTARIEAALRRVTINLERWEDAPLVELAEAVHAAEFAPGRDDAERIARLRVAADYLALVRREEHERWRALTAEVARHGRLLRTLGLRPEDLRSAPRLATAARWSARRLLLVLLLPLALLGGLLFWPATRLVRLLVGLVRPDPVERATFTALGGALVHPLWIALLAGLARWGWGGAAGIAALLVLPPLALLTLAWQTQWKRAWGEARRFLLLRRRPALQAELRQRQQQLAGRLERLLQEVPLGR